MRPRPSDDGQLQLHLDGPPSPDATHQPPALPDAADRQRITHALDHTLFIDAGAGSGKTAALVARICNLVERGADISSIAAITFTEKAAAELRHRLREELSARGHTDAAAGLDHAPIGTLHAFARRLLSDHPIEVGLPPRFDVIDEVQTASAFAERFHEFIRQVFDHPDAVRLVHLCGIDGLRLPDGLRVLAEDFQANWDLVEERVSADEPAVTTVPIGQLTALLAALIAAPVPPDDSQATALAEFETLRSGLEADDVPTQLQALAATAALKFGRRGNKEVWRKHTGDVTALDAFRTTGEQAADLATHTLMQLFDERRCRIGVILRAFTLASADDRRRRGRLEFHDLLVLARRLLRHHPEARAALHDRYRYVLLDEFQDTDPIQLELAVRLTADPRDQHVADWRSLQPLAGRLCVVGDPKQSIYRFRRADVAEFMKAGVQLAAMPTTLTSNFRSSAAVIDWVNHTMGTLIAEQDNVQPRYIGLTAQRPHFRDIGSVTALGLDEHDDAPNAAELRRREADDVADAIVTALHQGWQVTHRHGDPPTPVVRPCRLGDICVLLPARTSLPALEAALTARHVPYRAENSSLVYASAEVRSLMLALRAVDDPNDRLALVSVLRTPLFGCSDTHLIEWKHDAGRPLHIVARPPAADPAGTAEPAGTADQPPLADDHPVGMALAFLAALRERVHVATPAQLLSDLIDGRMVMELAATAADRRDIWRRIRFVLDQARAWSDHGGRGLRHYLDWVRLQGEDGRFVAETVLPETDHDAVRIMTIHAAKGLEFPITIVSGLSTQPQARRGRRVVWPEQRWALSDPLDGEYQQFIPVDETMSEAERRRLLYVAVTRAQDHLVVSMHRSSRSTRSAAHLLAMSSSRDLMQSFIPSGTTLSAVGHDTRELEWADPDEWEAERQRVLAAASRQTVISPTALAKRFRDDPAVAKGPVDLDLPPWQRGRYGTAIGRAVHAVLQYADLADGSDITALSVAQAAAEGILGHESTVAALAESARGSSVVRAALAGQHWRELFVGAAVGQHVVEGYIDLLVRRADGSLVVVDYKTDQMPDATTRQQRLATYATQLAAYGVVVETLLGEPVGAAVLVMCNLDGPADEEWVPDFGALMAEVRHQLITWPGAPPDDAPVVVEA